MRIIGEVAHQHYKITVFDSNGRLSIKIEDRTLEQTYKFRDGSGIKNMNDVRLFLDGGFMEHVTTVFSSMKKAYSNQLSKIAEDEDDLLDIL